MTYKLVKQAYANGLENDCAEFFAGLTDEQLAEDMMDCDAYIAVCPWSEVVAAIRLVREAHK